MIKIFDVLREIRASKVKIKELQKTAKAKIPPTRSADFEIFSNILESC